MRKQVQHQHLGFAFTVQEFCDKYNIGRTSLYKELQSGRLEAVKVGSKTLILPDAVALWLAALPRLHRK